MAWRPFNWGSRGPYFDTGGGIYVAQVLIPQAVQINLRGSTQTGNELMHVFGAITPASPVTYDDCLAVATAVASWASVTGGIRGIIPNVTQVNDVVVTARDVVEGPQATLPINTLGTRSGDPAPGSITFALKKAGNRAARWA